VRIISYTEALREALGEELRRDPSVFLLGEDIACYGGAFGVTRGLRDEFGPERVINTPISELSFVGAAVGASLVGSRPVVEIMFMDFIALAMDPIVNMAAKLHYVFGDQAKCPLVIRAVAGAGRCYGPTHSQSLEAWFMHTPGLKVVAPATPADAKGMLKTAIRDDNPVIFIEHKMLYGMKGPVPTRREAMAPFGKARIVTRGSDVTIVAWSWMAVEAEAAACELAGRGIKTQVIDLRSLCPLDMDPVVESVKKTGRLLIVEEGTKTAGISAEIGFQVFERVYDYLNAPIRRITTPDIPISASPILEQAAVPGRQRIVEATVELLKQ
jgi:pyruvate/2-oxoglutarate/acetoin dehydrogenase E1 component